jgi:Lipocalin-like domain
VENGQEVLANYTHTTTCEKDYIRFTGTVINSVYFEKLATTCNELNTPGTFVRTGDEIKITEDGVVKTIKILNLSATELKTSTVFPNGTFVEVYTKG